MSRIALDNDCYVSRVLYTAAISTASPQVMLDNKVLSFSVTTEIIGQAAGVSILEEHTLSLGLPPKDYRIDNGKVTSRSTT